MIIIRRFEYVEAGLGECFRNQQYTGKKRVECTDMTASSKSGKMALSDAMWGFGVVFVCCIGACGCVGRADGGGGEGDRIVQLGETRASSRNSDSVSPRRWFVAVVVDRDESPSFEREIHGLLTCSVSLDCSWSESMMV